MLNEINPIQAQLLEKAYTMPDFESSTDQELVEVGNAWLLESSQYYGELEKIWKVNEQYYLGNQTMMDRIPSDMSNAVQNQIFMGVETIVPIITANPPQFVVEPPENSDVSGKAADATQKILSIQYETTDVRTKGEALIRDMLMYRFGVWKVIWDENGNNVGLKNVKPKNLRFPKVIGDLPYLIEILPIYAGEFRDVFGDAKFIEFLKNRGKILKEGENLDKIGGLFAINEIWTPEMVFWTDGVSFIDKKKNPYYDFDDKDRNHFSVPEIPYIIASAFRTRGTAVGDTDLITQTIPIQDVINVSNRLIINNANKTGNSQWFVDASVMSEEEARNKLTNSPGLIIYGDNVANPNLLRRDPPPPLPAYIAELKAMAERAFDNIFGTHSTTRGERGSPETLGGRLLLKQADLGRIDLLVREYERCVAKLGNWNAQLMRLYFTGKRTFRYYGETGLEFIDFTADMIERAVKILVKSGTTLPTDELSKRREALELWGLNALAPETLFERLKFPDPVGEAKKLQAWRQNQILEEQMKAGAEDARPTPSAPKEVAEASAGIAEGLPLGGI